MAAMLLAPRFSLIHRLTVHAANLLHHIDHLADMPHHFNPAVAALIAAVTLVHGHSH